MTTKPAPYCVRAFDMGEDAEEETFANRNDASDAYDALTADTKQLLVYRAPAYEIEDQHVFGRRSFNINQ